eukprot:scaffold110589_cov17-Tisochrysis_lutea.AAC.1
MQRSASQGWDMPLQGNPGKKPATCRTRLFPFTTHREIIDLISLFRGTAWTHFSSSSIRALSKAPS